MAEPDDRSRPTFATGSPARTFRAASRHNHKACGRQSRPAAKRGGQEHKNKTETISADGRSYLKLHQLNADDLEWNRAFRHRSRDRQERRDQVASARAWA